MASKSHSVAINRDPDQGELVVLFSGHAQTEPLHKVGPQVLDYHLVHYVLSGQGRFQCMGREYRLGRGSSFFIFPGELVSYESGESEPWSYRWIGFRGSRADELLSRIGISPHSPVIDNGANRHLSFLFRMMESVLRHEKKGGDLSAGGIMRLLLGEYGKERSASSIRPAGPESEARMQVEQAIRWLTLQYSQPVSIEQMAQTLGYHRTHLSKLFKRHTGMSPMNFLLKIRMERAKLLLHEPLSIEQIASSVGFADALYFSKQFKKWHGSSPTEYRNSLIGKERFDCYQ